MIHPATIWVQCQHCSVPQPSRATASASITQRQVKRRSRRQRVYTCQCQSSGSGRAAAVRIDAAAAALLDQYWQSRGIFDEGRRERLVAEARRLDHAGAHAETLFSKLPSLQGSRQTTLLTVWHEGSHTTLLLPNTCNAIICSIMHPSSRSHQPRLAVLRSGMGSHS